MNSSERMIYLLKVSNKNVPKVAPSVEILDLFKMIYESWKQNKATFYYDKKGAIITTNEALSGISSDVLYIADMRFSNDEKKVSILINRGDASQADPAYLNTKQKKIRKTSRHADETIGFSAHFIIDIGNGEDGTYRATFERVTSITRIDLSGILNKILRLHCDGNKDFVYKNKREQEIAYHPRLDVHIQPVKLESGTIGSPYIQRVELTKHQSEFSGVDMPVGTIETSSKVVLRIDHTSIGDTLSSWVQSLADIAKKKNFTSINFIMRDPARDRTFTSRFTAEATSAADMLFAKSEVIGNFLSPLDQCREAISTEVEQKMLDIINDNGKWYK